MDSTSLADMIAIFMGVLELVKVNRIRILEDPDHVGDALHGANTRFRINEDYVEPEQPTNENDPPKE